MIIVMFLHGYQELQKMRAQMADENTRKACPVPKVQIPQMGCCEEGGTMNDTLYIVVYRSGPNSRWQAISEGEMPERRMAENLIECKKASGWKNFQFAIVEGPIFSPDAMAEAEAKLEAF